MLERNGSTIIGLPKGHNLSTALKTATSVDIAMAFATIKGWHFIKPDLLKGKAKIRIIVGVDGFISEPELLVEWLKLANEKPERFQIFVASKERKFHPKVICVESEKTSFAIVGSGNLTSGGMGDNIECGAYENQKHCLAKLKEWFDGLPAIPLDRQIVAEYTETFRKIDAKRRSLRSSKRLNELLQKQKLQPMSSQWNIQTFIDEALHYVQGEGLDAVADRFQAAAEIKALLHIPQFSFTKKEWDEFKRIPQFGRIRLTYEQEAHDMQRLKNGLRLLSSGNLTVDVLKAILDSSGVHHVHGVGINICTKVLCVQHRRKWPNYNRPVRNALSKYGLKTTATAAGYLKFVDAMKRALKLAPTLDYWSLDAFFEWKGKPNTRIQVVRISD